MKQLKIFLLTLLVILPFSLNAQWVPLGGSAGGDIMKLTVFNSNLYAGGTATLFRSTDFGINWTSVMPQLSYVWSIASSGSNIYCGVWAGGMGTPGGVYKSSNNGLNFSIVGLNNKNVSDLAADNQRILACAFVENGLFLSTDQGSSWNNIKGSLAYGIYYVGMTSSRIYAGSQGLHMTTNNGVNWTPVFMTDNLGSLSVTESVILVGTYSNGVYRSTNYGQTWTKTLNTTKRVNSLDQFGQYVFAGVDTGYFVSSDGGINFVDKYQGLGLSSISSTIVHNNYVYAANSNYYAQPVSIWKRPLSEVIGITNISSEIPEGFSLSQNYPNPFNPSTKIKFSIVSSPRGLGGDLVQLKIYDVMGREVQTLVNESLKPGTYEATFDGSNISSGIYFYKLMAGNYTATKKLTLLK